MDDNRKSTATKIAVSLLPTLLAILVMAGGWVYNFATTAAVLRDHERRLTTVEQTYVPHAVSEEKDKASAREQIEVQTRLNRIEEKLDQLNMLLLSHNKKGD